MEVLMKMEMQGLMRTEETAMIRIPDVGTVMMRRETEVLIRILGVGTAMIRILGVILDDILQMILININQLTSPEVILVKDPDMV